MTAMKMKKHCKLSKVKAADTMAVIMIIEVATTAMMVAVAIAIAVAVAMMVADVHMESISDTACTCTCIKNLAQKNRSKKAAKLRVLSLVEIVSVFGRNKKDRF
mmetsp:Transcript_72780/g.116098  ORF Transcript_72780/g.116098 Transcript_72780/m.116098 type:complete len:104 (-) Transcript_72780:74-385(-)